MISTAKVGLLDFGEAYSGEEPREIVAHTIAAARRADALGFGRYWLAEHQVGTCSWGSPELVLALIARETTRIRVGSGGLLLVAHNALRVANDFSLLAQLFPGRIDVGVARGAPGDNLLALIEPLRSVPRTSDDFTAKLVALLSYLRGIRRPQHAYFRAQAFPKPKEPPELWLLGSGSTSSVVAAEYGLPFAQSIFHAPNTPLDPLSSYSRDFRSSAWLGKPRSMVAIAGVCAETRERAHEIAASHTNAAVTLNVVGTASDWCERVAEILSTTGADEVMYLDVSQSPTQRLRAYELLAEALPVRRVARDVTIDRSHDGVRSLSEV